MAKIARLLTAQELEKLLGEKYFYRQSIYRMADEDKISTYEVGGISYFSKDEVELAALKRLIDRVNYRFPWVRRFSLRVNFEDRDNALIVYGFPDQRKITVNTNQDTEEDLLEKFRKEVINMPDMPVAPLHEPGMPPPPPPHHGPPPPPPHEREMMKILRRIEERLARIEEKLG